MKPAFISLLAALATIAGTVIAAPPTRYYPPTYHDQPQPPPPPAYDPPTSKQHPARSRLRSAFSSLRLAFSPQRPSGLPSAPQPQPSDDERRLGYCSTVATIKTAIKAHRGVAETAKTRAEQPIAPHKAMKCMEMAESHRKEAERLLAKQKQYQKAARPGGEIITSQQTNADHADIEKSQRRANKSGSKLRDHHDGCS